MEDRYQIHETLDGDHTVTDVGLIGDGSWPIATYPDRDTAELVAHVLNYHAEEEI